MRAVTYAGGEQLVRIEDRPRPQLEASTDAILRVTAAAICGTDLHVVEGKMPGTEEGIVLGHEFVGVVEDAGDASTVEVGQRYVASMITACGGCRPCSRHDYRNCAFFAMFGMGYAFGGLDGGQAERVRVPLADLSLAPVPEAIPDATAVLVSDILPTAYTAMLKGGVRVGDTVAIVGAGPVGQLAVMCAKLVGASKIFSVDLVADRLKEADALGAIPVDANAVDPSDFIFDHTGFIGADVVVEAVGSKSAVETAWSVARNGGVIALVGLLVDEPWPVSCGDNWLKAIEVRPVIGDSLTHRHDLLRLTEGGRIDPGSIVSHVLPLADAEAAYHLFAAREATKIVLTP